MSAVATTELIALPRSPLLATFFANLGSFTVAPEGVAWKAGRSGSALTQRRKGAKLPAHKKPSRLGALA